MLYSYKQQYPSILPNRIRLSNGITRTDSSTFTPEEIQDAGYIPAPNPPDYFHPNKLEWNKTEWIIRPPTQNEIQKQKQSIKDECIRRLFDTDYKVIKAYEQNVPVELEYVIYRQELRDLYNSVDELEDVWNIQYPSAPAHISYDEEDQSDALP